MKKAEEYLEELSETTRQMGEVIKKVKRAIGSSDYDLERLMKNVEADYMDMSHKVNLAIRLALGGRTMSGGKDDEE